jgi:AraC-like DNA-binding protein
MEQFLKFAIFAALGQILLIGVVIGRDLGRQRLGWIVLLLWLSVACYLISSDKTLLMQTGWFRFVVAVGSFSVPALLWAAACTLFSDEFRLRLRHTLAIAALMIIGYFNALVSDFFGAPVFEPATPFLFELTRPAQQFLNIGFMLSAFYTAYQGRNDDLLDGRRRFRMYFVSLGAGTATILALIELFIDASDVMGFHTLVGPPLVLSVTTLIGYWTLVVNGSDVIVELSQNQPIVAEDNIRPADRSTHHRLVEAFDEQFLYREHGLTIASLAGHLNVPEHHLRRLINKGMGFRNFAAFLNSYRLKDVVAAFSDPEQAGIPILTIALNAGFQSIATFNRAFRHAYRSTPSDFRKKVATGAH